MPKFCHDLKNRYHDVLTSLLIDFNALERTLRVPPDESKVSVSGEMGVGVWIGVWVVGQSRMRRMRSEPTSATAGMRRVAVCAHRVAVIKLLEGSVIFCWALFNHLVDKMAFGRSSQPSC